MNAPDFDPSLLPTECQEGVWALPSKARQGQAPPPEAAQGTAGPVPGRGRTNIRQAYIAGSCGPDARAGVLANTARAMTAACKLAGAGWSAIIPRASGSQDITWDTALKRCENVIQGMDPAMDCLVLLPGWEQSPGARLERKMALRSGIQVLTFRAALVGTFASSLNRVASTWRTGNRGARFRAADNTA